MTNPLEPELADHLDVLSASQDRLAWVICPHGVTSG